MTSFANDLTFDKNEYFAEMPDIDCCAIEHQSNKSHSQKYKQQTDARNQKLVDQVSQLPKKMREKLVYNTTEILASKTKVKGYKKGNRYTQSLIQKEYDETLLAEEDAYDAVNDVVNDVIEE